MKILASVQDNREFLDKLVGTDSWVLCYISRSFSPNGDRRWSKNRMWLNFDRKVDPAHYVVHLKIAGIDGDPYLPPMSQLDDCLHGERTLYFRDIKVVKPVEMLATDELFSGPELDEE